MNTQNKEYNEKPYAFEIDLDNIEELEDIVVPGGSGFGCECSTYPPKN